MVGKLWRRAFARDRRGVALVEFAMIVLPFFAIMLAILQYGLAFFGMVMLDYAARQSGRELMLGNVQAAGMNATTFRTNVFCPRLALFMRCDNVVVSVRPVAQVWTSARTTGVYAYLTSDYKSLVAPAASNAAAQYCPGAPTTTMMIDATYRMPVFFPMLARDVGFRLIGSNTSLLLRSTSMVTAEEYQTAAGFSGGAGC